MAVTRPAAIAAFLAAHGFGAATVVPLAQDASSRRYWRLTGGPAPAVLMDAPPEPGALAPFLRIGALLAEANLAVPAIVAAAPDQGLLLLEDFGDALLARVLTTVPPAPVYDAATDTLAALARITPHHLPTWGPAEMAAATAATFLDWWWPAAFQHTPSPAIRSDFAAAMEALLAPLHAQPVGLVHRDYFPENLFWLPDRAGARRIGIIDFQDAAIGPPAYDLVSLVEDARRDVPPAIAARARARYLAARPDLDPHSFAASFAICAAQRHLRVAALWVRLARRDHKPAYLAHGPRCWALLDRALAHPAAAPLAAFLDRHVPRTLRGNPA